jgi:large subunit ribosomal protein L10Ae
MSKLSVEIVEEAVKDIKAAATKKKRNFLETVELQVALKNYDPAKDKRFSGAIQLPTRAKSKFTVCVIGDAKDVAAAQKDGLPVRTVDDLKKLNKNKKLVKKMAAEFDAFLASSTLIRKIPRLIGPWLNKAGKFPTALGGSDSALDKADQMAKTVKFQLKSKKTLCMGVPLGTVDNTEEELTTNVVMAVNFMVGLLPKQWQQVKRVYVKSTMGPVQRIYGF